MSNSFDRSHDPFIPKCVHFGACAGCSEHLSLHTPPIWQEISSFFASIVAPQIQIHRGPPLHWRCRAKVAVRGTALHPSIGLFKSGTHEVVSIPHCLVHHPRLNQAFEIVRHWIHDHRLLPYQEKTGKGDIRYLQGVVQRKSEKVQLSIVLHSSSADEKLDYLRPHLHQLIEQNKDLWHSLWINCNTSRTNTIFGDYWECIWGDKELWEDFGDRSVCYGPASFGQANLSLFETMLNRIVSLLPPQARVAEFYAGVGVIGLFIVSHCEWVRCNEMNSFAEGYFNRSRSVLSEDLARRIQFFSGAVHHTFSLLDGANTVIVDPPRKGLDPLFFPELRDVQSVKHLFYISCGWESFQRDCQKLCADGWRVVSVDGYLFFPGSSHVELLVHFNRT